MERARGRRTRHLGGSVPNLLLAAGGCSNPGALTMTTSLWGQGLGPAPTRRPCMNVLRSKLPRFRRAKPSCRSPTQECEATGRGSAVRRSPPASERSLRMQIFLHTPTGVALVEQLDDTTTIADLMDKAGLTDATAWIENAEDPLELTDLVAQIAGDKGHVHVNHYRRVDVTINYGGKHKSHGFAPGATIQAVRQWAVG